MEDISNNIYASYSDFCKKTGLNGIEAVDFLLDELKKIRESNKH